MNINVEKFSVTELSVLRNELLQNGLDSWQAAELFDEELARAQQLWVEHIGQDNDR